MKSGGQPPLRASSRAEDRRAFLDSAERAAGIGSWEWTLETGELRWSDNLFRLAGLEPGSVTPTPEMAMELTHPDDRDRHQREVARVRNGGTPERFEYRTVRADGTIRNLRSTLALIDGSGKSPRILGTIHDVTDQRRAESQVAAHIAVSEALAEWESFDQGVQGLLRKLAQALDCVAGVLWVPQDDEIAAVAFWSADSFHGPEFEALTRRLRPRRGAGLAGQVWQTALPRAVTVADSPGYLRGDEAEAAGLRGALAFPAFHDEEVLAVIELSSAADAEPSEVVMRSLVGIGDEIGQFLARHRGSGDRPALTPRELEVLALAAQGHSRRQIAELLTVSLETVKTHFQHIYAKLGVSDRTAAVAKALRDGLIE
ncbi:MAG: hypothetical protein QOI10_461 [Solirubrobacterales bacterium]|nr:hypothetical protein [Solirubrobacterales bacterium]